MALLNAGQELPDVAFIDLHMPVKNGFDLLTELGAAGVGDEVPLFVLTSSTSEVDARKSKVRSALRVIVKPESMKLLERALASAIQQAYPSVASRRSKRAHALATSRLEFNGIDDFGGDKLG
jgi:DNA-binding response OmpR family regulator